MNNFENQFNPQLLYAVSIYGEHGVQTRFKTDQTELKRLFKAWNKPHFLRGNFRAQTVGDATNYLSVDLKRAIVIEAMKIVDEVVEQPIQNGQQAPIPGEVVAPAVQPPAPLPPQGSQPSA